MKDREIVGFLRAAARLGYSRPRLSVEIEPTTEALHIRFEALRGGSRVSLSRLLSTEQIDAVVPGLSLVHSTVASMAVDLERES